MIDDDQTPAHEMMLVKIYETGVEEWLCPICGRRLMMQRPPQFRRIILAMGDELVSHTASQESLRLVGAEDANTTATPRTSSHTDDAQLATMRVWADWIDQLDLSALGGTSA